MLKFWFPFIVGEGDVKRESILAQALSSFLVCIGHVWVVWLVCFLKDSSCRLICWSSSSSSIRCCESIQWIECVWLVFGWRTTLTDCHWRCHSSGLRYCRHILTSQPDGLSLEIRSQSRLAQPSHSTRSANIGKWIFVGSKFTLDVYVFDFGIQFLYG